MSQVVADASALVALLLDSGPAGTWARHRLEGAEVHVPTLAGYEIRNVLRRQELRGRVTAGHVRLALADFGRLTATEWPVAAVADRAWQLRDNLSFYDASYVALAEAIDGALVTLDARIFRAPGLRCPVHCPDAARR